MRTLVGINNLTMVDQMAYANHSQFWYRLGVWKGREESAGREVYFALCNPRRMTIDRMRNEAAKIALEGDFDYLMFIDDDVLVPFDAFHKLIKHDKDIIAGVTIIRGYPFHPMIFNFSEEYKDNNYVMNYKDKADPETGLLECSAVGFSCCLIKVDLLRKMMPPFFITSHNQTEDVYFCKRAKEQFPETSVFVDCTLHTGHILGSDIVEPNSVEQWRKFEEERNPALLEEKNKRGDREPKDTLKLVDAFPDKLEKEAVCP